MATLQEQIEQLSAARVQEIINDNSLSKINKLQTLERERLFGYSDFINHEFPDWEKEAICFREVSRGSQIKTG